jgi:hypothetical protein
MPPSVGQNRRCHTATSGFYTYWTTMQAKVGTSKIGRVLRRAGLYSPVLPTSKPFGPVLVKPGINPGCPRPDRPGGARPSNSPLSRCQLSAYARAGQAPHFMATLPSGLKQGP